MSVDEVYGEVLFDLAEESNDIDLFFNKIKFLDENILSEQSFLNPASSSGLILLSATISLKYSITYFLATFP